MRGVARFDTRYTQWSKGGIPLAWTSYGDGKPTGRGTMIRDSSGCAIRSTSYAMDGSRTGYSTNSYGPHTIESHYFTGDGKPNGSLIAYYNAKGILVRMRSYKTADKRYYHDSTFDTSTGLKTQDVQYDAGTFTNRDVPHYDANGLMISTDTFDKNGRRYETDDFTDGSLSAMHYTFANGSTRDITMKLNSLGYIISSEQRDDGVLHATFTVERLANFTVKRTIVHAADGSIIAEFPDMLVVEANADGSTPGHYQGTIYKKVPWW
jgi:antitoxin component YwqK of YwqJK toxin-antitoxin module